jgi:CRP-like cAMP-binding protein
VQNEKPSKIMIVKEGITKCLFTKENDKEYMLEFLGKGEIDSEIELIRDIPCLCNIEALADIAVYALSIPYFTALIKSDLALDYLGITLRSLNRALKSSGKPWQHEI